MVKKAAALKIGKKRNGKFVVKKRGGGRVNGADKVAALVDAGLIKQLKKKEAPAEGSAG